MRIPLYILFAFATLFEATASAVCLTSGEIVAGAAFAFVAGVFCTLGVIFNLEEQ